MTALEFMEKRAKAWEDAKNFLDTHITDAGLSAEDQNTHDKMLADVENLSAAIKRLEEQRNFEDAIKKQGDQPILNKPAKKEDDEKQAFIEALRGYNFQNALQTAPGELGGYLVPETFWNEIVFIMTHINVMRRLCRVITTSSDLNIPVEASGAAVGYVAEGALIPETNVTFIQKKISAHKIGALIKATSELLQDSMFDIETYVKNEFAQKFAAKEEQEFINGDGADGHIEGLLTASDLPTVTTAGASITFDDVIELVHKVPPSYRGAAQFLTSDTAVKTLRKIKDTTGNYIWSPSLVPGQPDRIYGYPVNISTSYEIPASGKKAVAFGDFSGYWIANRLGMSIQRLNELYAVSDQIGFVAKQRVDGKLIRAASLAALVMA